ncbi:MAG: HEAT repeat domain-containing protein [Deltaproteobacteria bacterium]|nr:HEAT repeat domain-containing protein [Deltaproteobacteria bacterium]
MENQPDIPGGAGTASAPPAPAGPPPTGERPREDDRRIPAVEEIFRQLIKAVKTIAIYSHNPKAFEGFINPVFTLISKFLKTEQALPLRVDATSFIYMGAEVYRETGDDLNLTYKFYRDGVRKLVFRQGIELPELLKFVSIASASTKGTSAVSEDTVSLLWKAGFENIDYVVVEGIAAVMGDEDEDGARQAEVEVEKVTDFVASRLRSGSDDVVRFARVCADDLNLELGDVQSIRGVVTVGEICPQAFKDAIQFELQEEDEKLMMQKILLILFAVVKYGFDDRERDDICENLLFLLDSLLLREDFKGVVLILERFDQITADPKLGVDLKERVFYLKYRLIEAMSSEARLDRLRTILSSGTVKDPGSVRTYLASLNNDAKAGLPAIMEAIENAENLRVVGDFLAGAPIGGPEAVQKLVASNKVNLVIEGLRILRQMDFPGRGALITKLLGHTQGAVRLAALRSVSTVKGEEAKTTISRALDDADKDVRSAALEAAQNFEPDWTGRMLFRVMSDERFKLRLPDEQQKFANAAAATGAQQVYAMFNETLSRKSGLFNRKEVNGPKLMVVEALRAEGSLAAFRFLQNHVEQKHLDPEVKAACKKAMDGIKQRLVGD